jgi:hypothetical protein
MLAWLAGSHDEYVNWRSLSIQLGFVLFFFLHLGLFFLKVDNFMLYASGLTLLSILIIQWLLRSKAR